MHRPQSGSLAFLLKVKGRLDNGGDTRDWTAMRPHAGSFAETWVRSLRVGKTWFVAVTHANLVLLLGIFCPAEPPSHCFQSQPDFLHELTHGEVFMFSSLFPHSLCNLARPPCTCGAPQGFS